MRNLRILLFSAVLILFISSSVQAISISISTQSTGLYTTPAGAILNNLDFENGDPPPDIGFGWSIGGNYHFVTGAAVNLYAAPVYGGITDASRYLSVPEDRVGNGSTGYPSNTATIFFGGGNYNYLGLLWGSIDTYNSITFLRNDGYGAEEIAYVHGDEIPDANHQGGQSGSADNKYVHIYTDFYFDSIDLTSTQYAMEVDDIAVANVPEPGSTTLLVLGFFGMSIFRRCVRTRPIR